MIQSQKRVTTLAIKPDMPLYFYSIFNCWNYSYTRPEVIMEERRALSCSLSSTVAMTSCLLREPGPKWETMA